MTLEVLAGSKFSVEPRGYRCLAAQVGDWQPRIVLFLVVLARTADVVRKFQKV